MYIIDSRRLLSSHSGSSSLSMPSVVARRRRPPGGAGGGWSAGGAAMALAIESTRNGMSSLTMPIRIRRRPASPPVDSIASATSPLAPAHGDPGEEVGRLALVLAGEALGFAGQCVAGQRLAQCLDQRLGQARMDRHDTTCSASGAMAGAYRRRRSATGQRPSVEPASGGAADGALDHRGIVDQRDRLVTAVGAAAGEHQAEFLVRRQSRRARSAGQRAAWRAPLRRACRRAARAGAPGARPRPAP